MMKLKLHDWSVGRRTAEKLTSFSEPDIQHSGLGRHAVTDFPLRESC